MDLDFGAIAGGVIGKAVDVWSAREASKDERAFMERMSSTSYQRAVADMRAAGINPMLAYMQGGASTPSTSAADTGSFSASLSSAVQARRVAAETELLNQQTASAKEQARKTRIEADILKRDLPRAQIIEDVWKGVAGVYSSAKDVSRYVKETAETFPLVPRDKPYRQALQPLTDAQREQLRRTGSYTRPARHR